MGGDSQHRQVGAVGIEEAVDEVQVARATGTGTDSKLTGDFCFGSGGEGGGFFVPDMNPTDVLGASNSIDDGVEGVAYDAVDVSDASFFELMHQMFCNCSHCSSFCASVEAGKRAEAFCIVCAVHCAGGVHRTGMYSSQPKPVTEIFPVPAPHASQCGIWQPGDGKKRGRGNYHAPVSTGQFTAM